MIAYHFGGKHDLYLAVFDHIVERLGAELAPAASAASRVLEAFDGPKPAQALALLQQLLGRLLEVLASPESAAWAKLILKEQQEPSEAFDRLYGGFMGRVADLCTRLVACAGSLPPDSHRARLLAFMFLGQVLVFRSAHAAALRHLQWTTLGPKEIAEIKAQVSENIALMLGSTG
ncbi:hypothetical protein GCM10027514_28380 [Azotobacter armeniacus]